LQVNGKAIINTQGAGTTNSPVLRVGVPRSIAGTANMLFLAGFDSNYWKFINQKDPSGNEIMYVRHGSVDLSTNSGTIMSYREDGKVGVGNISSFPGAFNMYVEDGILTERVKIATMASSDWADYVFNDNYRLMSLPEINTFIKEHRHLPNIPSAQQVEENGYELQQMDAKLLEKIEELYLLTIELNEEKENLKEENETLKQRLDDSNSKLNDILIRINNIENKHEEKKESVVGKEISTSNH